MLSADNYETETEITSLLAEGRVPIGRGENTRITQEKTHSSPPQYLFSRINNKNP